MMLLSRLRCAVALAEESLASVESDRAAALALWTPRISEALRARADARKALITAEAAIKRKLAGWIIHDGGAQPVSDGTMILYRVKHEWAVMQDGGEPSLSEGVEGCEAERVAWEWIDSEWEDIAAYRIVATSGMEARQGGNAVPSHSDDSPTGKAGDAQP